MLLIKRNKIIEKWFYEKVSICDIFKLVEYRQAKNKMLLFKTNIFYTIHINLLDSEENIFQNFAKNTRYEIKKARRENAKLYQLNITKEEYIKVYNSFAREKNLTLLTINEISYYWDKLIILGAGKNRDDIFVIHSYICDNYRSRLFHSISLFRINNSIDSKIAGNMNRFLHFEAIKFFKNKKYHIYDLGGIGKIESTIAIDKFKMSFSKNIIKEYNLISPILFLLLKIRGLI